MQCRREPCIMACDICGKTATVEVPMGKKFSAKRTASNKQESNGASTSGEKRKKRIGTRLKALPKALTHVRCCQSNTLSIDESLEDGNCLVYQAMNPDVMLCRHTFEDSTGEDMKLSCMQHIPGHGMRLDVDIGSCRCSRNSFDYDPLTIERSCKKSLEPSAYKRLGSNIYNQCDSNACESRSRSFSRQTYASSGNNTFSRSSSLNEWHIPFDDISLDEMIATSCKGPIYRGRWHGGVLVHRISNMKRADFLKEVALLNLIRHENIILYMGACIEAPNLAIVTSPAKGCSLYAHIHEKITVFTTRSKIDIITQIAQGMEYLHAKKVELGRLCSRNVFLESKVKIGMTDYIHKHKPIVKSSYGYIPDRQIFYYGPELLRCLRVKDGMLCSDKPASFASDVFAYGTILFEIFLEEYPYATDHLEIVIWNVSSGRTLHTFTNIPIAVGQDLIEVCWSFQQSNRPSFQQILEKLKRHEKPRLNRQHSISQPNVINFNYTNLPIYMPDDY